MFLSKQIVKIEINSVVYFFAQMAKNFTYNNSDDFADFLLDLSVLSDLKFCNYFVLEK